MNQIDVLKTKINFFNFYDKSILKEIQILHLKIILQVIKINQMEKKI